MTGSEDSTAAELAADGFYLLGEKGTKVSVPGWGQGLGGLRRRGKIIFCREGERKKRLARKSTKTPCSTTGTLEVQHHEQANTSMRVRGPGRWKAGFIKAGPCQVTKGRAGHGVSVSCRTKETELQEGDRNGQ